MKLLRHILSHLLLITFLVAIALAYYFRPIVFPDAVNTKINAWVESVYPPAAKLVYHQSQQSGLKNKSATPSVASVAIAPVVKRKEPLAAEEEASVPIAIKEKEMTAVVNEVVQKLKDLVPEEEVIPAAESAKQEQVDTPIVETAKQEQAKTLAQVDEQPPALINSNKPSDAVPNLVQDESSAVNSDRDEGTEKKLLVAARQAYKKQDMDTAISKYRQLIELDEHSPNAFGEMGNIYYLQGKWQEAGAAYYEAAVRLVESGQMHQVAYLHRVIQGLDRNKAEQLAVKMNHGRM